MMEEKNVSEHFIRTAKRHLWDCAIGQSGQSKSMAIHWIYLYICDNFFDNENNCVADFEPDEIENLIKLCSITSIIFDFIDETYDEYINKINKFFASLEENNMANN
jgi:hypothetical protein